MLAVTLLVTVAAFLISIWLSRSFTHCIGQLERSMRQVEEGDVSVHLDSGSNGEDQIPIRDEVRHAQMYLTILDYRFADRFQTEWSIAPEIENCPIVKIVLQPLIENAAIHGIFEKDPPTGYITVRGWQEGNDIYLTVTDDGVGMDGETVWDNFQPVPDGDTSLSGGYGVRNINERLRLFYGPGYGLSCDSARAGGPP